MGQLLWMRGRERLPMPLLRNRAGDTATGSRMAPALPVWTLVLAWLLLEAGLSFTDRSLELVRWQAMSGLVLGLLLGRFLSQRLTLLAYTPAATAAPDRDLALRQGLDQAIRLQAALDLKGAEAALSRLNETWQGRGEILERLAGLRAYLQGPAVLHEVIPPALEALSADPAQGHAAGRLHQMYRRDKSTGPLPQDLLERLLVQSVHMKALAFGKVLAQEAQQNGMVSERLSRALASLAEALESEDGIAAQRIRRQAEDTASRLAVTRH